MVRAPEGAKAVRFGCRLEAVRPGLERNNRRYAWVDGIAWGRAMDFRVQGKTVGNVFQEEEVAFDLKVGDDFPTHVAVEVYDFWDRRLDRFEWSPEKGGDVDRLELGKMDPGYYELRWTLQAPEGFLSRSGATSFCVLRAPDEPVRPAAIAVDGALSWFYRRQDLVDVSELCRKIGLQCIRDRMNWDQVERERGKFDPDFLDTSATVQHEAGMEVYQDFGGTPPWALNEEDRGGSLPADLFDVYRVMRNLTSHFRGRVDSWEIWNEPYHANEFSGRPDEYVAYLKAAYCGCKAGNPDSVVLTCSFNTEPTLWGDRAVENGALEYADLYNFHSYSRKENLVENIGLHRKRMIDYGRKLPMWLTEDGSRCRRDVLASRLAGEQIAARYAVEWAVMSLAEGVDRHFYFVVPEMFEGAEGPWGILRKDLTPKPHVDPSALDVAEEPIHWPRSEEAVPQNPQERMVWFHVKTRGLDRDLPSGEYGGDLRLAVQTSPTGATHPLSVMAYNFSGEDVDLKISVKCPVGLGVSSENVSLRVPAFGKATQNLELLTSEMAPDREYRVVFTGEAEGFRITDSVVYFQKRSSP